MNRSCRRFGLWFCVYLELHDLECIPIAKELNVAYTTVYSWRAGTRAPLGQHMALLMVYLAKETGEPREKIAREMLESFLRPPPRKWRWRKD